MSTGDGYASFLLKETWPNTYFSLVRPESGKRRLRECFVRPYLPQTDFSLKASLINTVRIYPCLHFRRSWNSFCKCIQKESLVRQEQWKSSILKAVGDLAHRLLDLEPALESIIGPQAPIQKISPTEAKYRFANVIRAFHPEVKKPERSKNKPAHRGATGREN